MRCDFCGFEFDPACTTQGCAGCPLAKGCSRIACPRCGYEMLPEARLIGWMKKTFKKTGRGRDRNTARSTESTR